MELQDSFSIGTSATGGVVKVFFDEDSAEKKIQLAKKLYQAYVMLGRMKKEINKNMP